METPFSEPFKKIKIRHFIPYAVLWFVLTIGAEFIVGIFEISSSREEAILKTINGLLLYSLMLVFIVRKLKKNGYSLRTVFFSRDFEKIKIHHLLFILFILIIFSISSFYVSYYPVSLIFPDFATSVVSKNRGLDSFDIKNITTVNIIYMMTICFIAPFVEEIFFRGFLLNRLAQKKNMVFGLITSSLLFGLFHDNVLGMFGFGIVMSVLLLRTKSLHYSILCHMCNNTIPYIIKIGDSFGTDKYESTLTVSSLRDYFPIMFIVFIISISIIIRYTYKTVKNFAIQQE